MGRVNASVASQKRDRQNGGHPRAPPICDLRGSHPSPAQAIQEALLQRILRHRPTPTSAATIISSAIHDRAEFQKNVPVAPYEYVEPYIRRVTQGDYRALLSDPKVHMFAMTSGTTAARKFIPVTNAVPGRLPPGLEPVGPEGLSRSPRGPLSADRAVVRRLAGIPTPAGMPCGSVTGLTAAMQMRIVRWLYCVPGSVGKIKDAAAKNYLALRLSMARRVGMIIAANPSTLVNLARAGDQEKETLLRDLARRHAQQPFRHSRRHPSRAEPAHP